MADKKTSPWVYVGCGCVAAVVLVGALLVGGGFLFYRKVKQWEAEIEDPAVRAEKVRQVLGYQEPPEGYYPLMGMTIPFVMEMAFLTDQPPSESGEVNDQKFRERGFLYFRMSSLFKERDLEDYFEGRTDDPEALRHSNIHIDRGKVLGRGSMRVGDMDLRYVSQLGDMRFGSNWDQESLTTLLLVGCPDDGRTRMGIWFSPGPLDAEETPPEELNLTGTIADESRIRDFVSQLQLCG